MMKPSARLKQLASYGIHFAMIVAVAVYVFLGAIAIQHIEATPKADVQVYTPAARMKRQVHEIRRLSINRTKLCVLHAVSRIAKDTNCTQDITHNHLEWIDECYVHDLRRIAEFRRKEELGKQHKTSSYPRDSLDYEYWSLMDSILFCFTVVTTIGYGNVAPRTFHGRLFTILYGLVGVPFTMLAIANLGKFLATVLKSWTRPFIRCIGRCRRRICKPRYTTKEKQRLVEKQRPKSKAGPDDESSDGEEEEEQGEFTSVTDTIVLFVSFVLYIVVGSIAIATYEPNMDFFEAIYFNFVTLTTIGLGDLVPQSQSFLLITLAYCAVGLALTTIAIEIAADTLKKLHYFGRKVENVANVQIWFGGKKISMKNLVKNLGDQFNVPVDELHNLNIDKFVDDAIKVEQGELATLRVFQPYSPQDKDWMNSNYWRAIESGSMHYVDDDDLVTLQSNRNYYSEF